MNFGNGFNTITLPSFVDLGTTDFLRIVNGGTGNNAGGQISAVAVNTVAVPGPVAGAGLPALFGLAGAWFLRRRRHQAA